MSEPSSLPESRGPAPSQRLTDRVLARIRDARRDLQARSSRGGRSKDKRRITDSDTPALRRVFIDFGKSYRSYRRRTGEPVAPEVRDAAIRFRRDLDLTSLVTVAAMLERLDGDMVS